MDTRREALHSLQDVILNSFTARIQLILLFAAPSNIIHAIYLLQEELWAYEDADTQREALRLQVEALGQEVESLRAELDAVRATAGQQVTGQPHNTRKTARGALQGFPASWLRQGSSTAGAAHVICTTSASDQDDHSCGQPGPCC